MAGPMKAGKSTTFLQQRRQASSTPAPAHHGGPLLPGGQAAMGKQAARAAWGRGKRPGPLISCSQL